MTEKHKRYRVPHCSECNKCKYTQMPWSNTKEYSCYKDANSSEWGEIIGFLGKDHPPKVIETDYKFERKEIAYCTLFL